MSINVSVFNITECFNCSQGNGTSSDVNWLNYFVVIDVISVLNNILIVALIYKENETVSTSNKLMIHQAVADMFTSLTFLLNYVCLRFGLDVNVVNLVTSFLVYVSTAESLQMLSASVSCMSFAIDYPILYRVYNKTWLVRLVTLGTWFVNLAVGSLMFIVGDAFKPIPSFLSFASIKPGSLWYEVLKFVFVFILPMCGIVSLIRIVVKSRSQSSMGVESQSNTKALTRKAFVVMTFFFMYWTCLLFIIVIDVVSPFDPDKPWAIMDYIVEITYLIIYHLICLKLPVFLVVFKSYRIAARKIFCCFSCKKVSSEVFGNAVSYQMRSSQGTSQIRY